MKRQHLIEPYKLLILLFLGISGIVGSIIYYKTVTEPTRNLVSQAAFASTVLPPSLLDIPLLFDTTNVPLPTVRVMNSYSFTSQQNLMREGNLLREWFDISTRAQTIQGASGKYLIWASDKKRLVVGKIPMTLSFTVSNTPTQLFPLQVNAEEYFTSMQQFLATHNVLPVGVTLQSPVYGYKNTKDLESDTVSQQHGTIIEFHHTILLDGIPLLGTRGTPQTLEYAYTPQKELVTFRSVNLRLLKKGSEPISLKTPQKAIEDLKSGKGRIVALLPKKGATTPTGFNLSLVTVNTMRLAYLLSPNKTNIYPVYEFTGITKDTQNQEEYVITLLVQG